MKMITEKKYIIRSPILIYIFMLLFIFCVQGYSQEIDYSFLKSFGRGPSKGAGEFNYPSGVSVNSSTGEVFIMDTLFHRVQKFGLNGTYISHWRVNNGLGLSVDNSDNTIYVVIPNENKVKKFDNNGLLILEWGENGSDEGQFKEPNDVSVDQINGNVYIIDAGNRRVQVFDRNGNFLKSWNGQFYRPFGLSIDHSSEYVYVANTGGCNIQKFDLNGNLILKWGQIGSEPGNFRWPRGISVDSLGNVYVADSDMERIQKFDSEGNFLMQFQGPHNYADGPFHPRAVDINLANNDIYVAAAYAQRIDKFTADGVYQLSWGYLEKDGSVLNQPKGITVFEDLELIYIADTLNHLIKVFSKDGNFVKQFGGPPPVNRDDNYLGFPIPLSVHADQNFWGINQGIYYPDDLSWGSNKFVRQYDKDGIYIDGFSHEDFGAGMKGLAYDYMEDEIYISNTIKNKIMKFDSTGNLLLEFGSYGTNPGSFIEPAGIALDTIRNFIFIVDSGNSRIQKFTLNGDFVTTWGVAGTEQGEFRFASHSSLSVDKRGNVFVADTKNSRVQVFNNDGNFIDQIGTYGWGDQRFAWPSSTTLLSSVDSAILYVLDTGGNEIEMYSIVYDCPGDFNNNGAVNGEDLKIFSTYFGRLDCSDELLCEGNLNGDADCDGLDLGTFLIDFGRTNCF
jgi:DNA-binding beta-propeller fold protein YncE